VIEVRVIDIDVLNPIASNGSVFYRLETSAQ
jgi:hypothetical protein